MMVIKLLFIGLLFFSSTGVAATARAQSTTPTGSSSVTLPNPITCKDATCLISQVIRYIFGIIAIVATLMFIWGGILMVTSGGNSDQIKRAKETLAWASIGIIVILLSWGIIRFVISGLTQS